MKSIPTLFLSLLLVISAAPGCGRSNPPLPPLEEGQVAAEFQRVFAKAPPAAKELSTKLAAAVTAKQYPSAFDAAQMLQTVPGLTKEQQALTARAFITISSLLQSAGTQGDQDAAATIKQYRSNR